MKVILPFFLILITGPLFSQSLIGNWQGAIDANGNKIPIIFHFFTTDNKLDGKWDSPSQNANGLPFSQIQQNGDSIHLAIQMISGSYEGKFVQEDSITGMWHQGGGAINLNFKKTAGDAYVKPNRPQTPKPPFNYDIENVVYSNSDHSIQYGATFTLPKLKSNNQKFPAVILITGSGKQDRDETLFDHKPFAVIADYLSKNGIAVLRVDDRGMGQTTGNFDTSSSADFSKDVEAGLAYLNSRKEINTKSIGLIGHSEGGYIAANVAANNKQVAFIVMLAGPGVTGAKINDSQNEIGLKSLGMSAENIRIFFNLHHKLVEMASSEISGDQYLDSVGIIYKEWKKQQKPETLNQFYNAGNLILPDDEKTIALFQTNYSAFHSKWFRYFLNHDPAKDIEKLSIPVLALNGSRDVQVDPAINLPAIKEALRKSKSKKYEVKELPGLNHLFQHCKTCTAAEYGQLEETFSPEVLVLMNQWIHEVVGK